MRIFGNGNGNGNGIRIGIGTGTGTGRRIRSSSSSSISPSPEHGICISRGPVDGGPAVVTLFSHHPSVSGGGTVEASNRGGRAA